MYMYLFINAHVHLSNSADSIPQWPNRYIQEVSNNGAMVNRLLFPIATSVQNRLPVPLEAFSIPTDKLSSPLMCLVLSSKSYKLGRVKKRKLFNWGFTVICKGI